MSMALQQRMKGVLRQDVQSMHAYAVQPSAGMVKVDTMENPFRLPPDLRHALGQRLAEVALNRYPAERGDVLRAALAAHAGMPPGCDIMLGNGSDELIALLALACDVPGNTVLAPLPATIHSLADNDRFGDKPAPAKKPLKETKPIEAPLAEADLQR